MNTFLIHLQAITFIQGTHMSKARIVQLQQIMEFFEQEFCMLLFEYTFTEISECVHTP